MNASSTRARKSRIQVIPTCGEPLGFNASEDSSSRLGARLAVALGGDGPDPLSLAGVPALIPREFLDRGEIEIIKRLLDSASSYRKIFGSVHTGRRGDTPLIEVLDALVTSIGWSRSRMAEREIRDVGKWTQKQRDLMLGDVGGALVPQPELSSSGQDEFRRLCELSTGLQLTHLHRLALAARESAAHHTHGVPGVIVIAIGKSKAALTYEVIRRGLVNRLICDGSCERSRCDVRHPTPRTGVTPAIHFARPSAVDSRTRIPGTETSRQMERLFQRDCALCAPLESHTVADV